MKTVNQFLKEMTEVFGKVEYRAEKDGQVFKSKGYIDVDGNWVNPYVPKKMESKNGGKMSSVRTSKKAYK
jgi:hypothetical protein